jgi:hypothetical protein
MGGNHEQLLGAELERAWSWYAMTGGSRALRNALVASTKSTVGVAIRANEDGATEEPLLVSISGGPTGLLLAAGRLGVQRIVEISHHVAIIHRPMVEVLVMAARSGTKVAYLLGDMDAVGVLSLPLLREMVGGGELIEDGGGLYLSIVGGVEWREEVSRTLPTWVRTWLLSHLDSVADLDRAWLVSRVGDSDDFGVELVLEFSWDIPDEVRLDRTILLSRLLVESGAMREIHNWAGVSYLPSNHARDGHSLNRVQPLFSSRPMAGADAA